MEYLHFATCHTQMVFSTCAASEGDVGSEEQTGSALGLGRLQGSVVVCGYFGYGLPSASGSQDGGNGMAGHGMRWRSPGPGDVAGETVRVTLSGRGVAGAGACAEYCT